MTARDAYGNPVTTGDAGFQMVSPPATALKPDTFSRTVSGAEALFRFRITAAAVYIIRFEDATGALVHQSKFRIQPGGLSHRNSRYTAFPASFVVGQTWLGVLQIRDAYDNVFVDAAAAAQFVLSATDAANPSRSVPVRSLALLFLRCLYNAVVKSALKSFDVCNIPCRLFAACACVNMCACAKHRSPGTSHWPPSLLITAPPAHAMLSCAGASDGALRVPAARLPGDVHHHSRLQLHHLHHT